VTNFLVIRLAAIPVTVKKKRYSASFTAIFFQFFIEVLFWTVISYLTGGLKSPYLYVIIINIMYSAIILQEKGALFTTTAAFTLLVLNIYLIKHSFLPLISEELVEIYSLNWKNVKVLINLSSTERITITDKRLVTTNIKKIIMKTLFLKENMSICSIRNGNMKNVKNRAKRKKKRIIRNE